MAPGSDVTTYIIEVLAKQGVAAASPADVLNQRLSSLGLDSLDLMELLNDVEERFDIRIEDDTLSAETTVAEFGAFIEAAVAARKT